MKKLLLISTALGALGAFSGAASAADYMAPAAAPYSGGFYASLHGGVLLPNDPSVTFGANLNAGGTVDVENGYRFGGSLGYDFNQNFAIEFETSYARSEVSSIGNGFISLPAPGYGSALSLMGNAIIGNHYGAWRPYVGAGVGASLVSLNVDFMSDIDDSDWAFSAQAFAGVDYQLSDRVSIGGRYRFQHIGETSYRDNIGNPVDLGALNLHSFEIALKFKFGG